MVHRIIKLLIETLGHVKITNGEFAPAEVATSVVEALKIEEVGWLCDSRQRVTALPDCDQCYPVFRLRGAEQLVDRQFPQGV